MCRAAHAKDGAPTSWRDEFHLWRTAQPASAGGHRGGAGGRPRRSAAAAANAERWRAQFFKWSHPQSPPAKLSPSSEPPELRPVHLQMGALPRRGAQRPAAVPFGLQPTAYKIVNGRVVSVHVDEAKAASDRTPETEEDLLEVRLAPESALFVGMEDLLEAWKTRHLLGSSHRTAVPGAPHTHEQERVQATEDRAHVLSDCGFKGR